MVWKVKRFAGRKIVLAERLTARGQLAIIKDSDGSTNVREGKGTGTKIVGKFFDGEVFSYSGAKNEEWVSVYRYPEDLKRIDGRKPVGSDGIMPHEKLIGFRMTIAGQPVNIPEDAWNDVYLFGFLRTGNI